MQVLKNWKEKTNTEVPWPSNCRSRCYPSTERTEGQGWNNWRRILEKGPSGTGTLRRGCCLDIIGASGPQGKVSEEMGFRIGREIANEADSLIAAHTNVENCCGKLLPLVRKLHRDANRNRKCLLPGTL